MRDAPLAVLGWGTAQQEALERLSDASLMPGRVVGVDRRRCDVAIPEEGATRVLPGTCRSTVAVGTEAPTVGDWVACRSSGEAVVIEHVLPRSSCFVRKAAGTRTTAQLVAANVDRVFVVTAIGEDLSARRVERYVAAVWAGGAEPVVVVNKTDRPHEPESVRHEMELAAPGVGVVMLSCVEEDGLAGLVPLLVPGMTLVLVGSSGVGKSTIANRLLSEERIATQPIRRTVDKGRHTTTRRQLMLAPSGVLLIDTPGMRELGLWEAEAGIAATFPDVEELAARCRFRDCAHDREPGCAVVAAAEDGLLPAERLASYRRLTGELAETSARVRDGHEDSKKRWKGIAKDARARRRLHRNLSLKDD
jgi:ribosome biogenesis GTPase